MKRFLILILMVSAGWALAADVAVVDMEKLVRSHPRTAADRQVLQQYIEDFEVEREERMASLEKLKDEFDALRQEAEDITLAADVAREKRQMAQLKFEELRRAEMELREIAAQRQKELSSQELRMVERVVSDIRRAVQRVAAKESLDLILDSGSEATAGYASVVFADEALDVTDDVLSILLKNAE